MQSTVDMSCPGCGAPVSTEYEVCPYCHRPVVISSFTSVAQMPLPEVNKYASAYKNARAANPENTSLGKAEGLCYLKLGLYDKAIAAFENAFADNFDDSETYFYAAVSLLEGRPAFAASRASINKAVEYINAALMIESRGIYYFVLAYIKYDYFERKSLRTTPDYYSLMEEAGAAGFSSYDVSQVTEMLRVEMPEELI